MESFTEKIIADQAIMNAGPSFKALACNPKASSLVQPDN